MDKTDHDAGPRLYGEADPANRTPPAPEGLRGEGAAAAPNPDLQHAVLAAGGDRVVVEEESGTAFTEATGQAGGDAQREAATHGDKTTI